MNPIKKTSVPGRLITIFSSFAVILTLFADWLCYYWGRSLETIKETRNVSLLREIEEFLFDYNVDINNTTYTLLFLLFALSVAVLFVWCVVAIIIALCTDKAGVIQVPTTGLLINAIVTLGLHVSSIAYLNSEIQSDPYSPHFHFFTTFVPVFMLLFALLGFIGSLARKDAVATQQPAVQYGYAAAPIAVQPQQVVQQPAVPSPVVNTAPKYCSVCNTDNPQNFKFCRACGTPLDTPAPTAAQPAPLTEKPVAENEIVCPTCGIKCDPSVTFCKACGTKLK